MNHQPPETLKIPWREALESKDPAALAAARAAIEQSLRANPARFDILDIETQLLHAQGEDQLAERLLDEYLRYDPSSAAASARLAWLHWVNGRQEDGLAEVEATLARSPNSIEARQLAMQWQVEMGQPAKAIRLGQQALDQGLETATIHHLMGLALGTSGDNDGAIASMRRALALEPDSEEHARNLARLLMTRREAAEAFRLLEPFALRENASWRTWMAAARIAHSARLPLKGNWFLQRLATDPRADSDETQHDVILCAVECLGSQGAESMFLDFIENGIALDSLGVELLETFGGQGNRAKIERLFVAAGRQPNRYPRTIARFFSTFHDMTSNPSLISRWLVEQAPAVQASLVIRAGIAAWHVAQGRWQQAVDSLRDAVSRPDARPWMILLLGRAHEGLGEFAVASHLYRQALQLPADHSEAGLRSRLAFNEALEGNGGVAKLVLLESSPRVAQLATLDDRARVLCVEAFFAAGRTESREDRLELLRETEAELELLRKQDRRNVVIGIQRLFRQRMQELLQESEDAAGTSRTP